MGAGLLLHAFLTGAGATLTPVITTFSPPIIVAGGKRPLAILLQMALTYALLGALAGLLGTLLPPGLHTPLGLLVLALGALYLTDKTAGELTAQTSVMLYRLKPSRRQGPRGTLLLPLLASNLAWSLLARNPAQGLLLMLLFGLGLALPLLFIIYIAPHLKNRPGFQFMNLMAPMRRLIGLTLMVEGALLAGCGLRLPLGLCGAVPGLPG